MPSKEIDVEKLKTLVEINELINSSYTDVNTLLVYILESAMRLVECESSSILLVNKANDNLSFEVALGPKGLEAAGILVKKEGSIAGWVVENNKSLILNDVANDPRFFSTVQDQTGYLTKTMIAVPMRIQGHCIGVIELLNKASSMSFNQKDLEIIELLSIQASLAYQNAEIYRQARHEITVMQTTMTQGAEYHAFIYKSKVVSDLVSIIDQVAPTNSSVLILGESGVGKELFAEQIHLKSNRNKNPFIRVNCAALSPTLLESELFGHVKGAFTDAVNDRKGRFEAADGGTIFLDEIGELSLDLQVKLLRVIQSRSFEKVGSSETITVDVRIITATNKDLEKMVEQGKFRSDLFYRLNVVPLLIPPLRERKDDIELLASYFCRKFSIEIKKSFIGLSQDALDTVLSYYWPGNVRELENSIERACVLGKPPYIQSNDLRLSVKKSTMDDIEDDSDNGDRTLKTAIDNFKKRYITKLLNENSWNQTEVARILDVQRTYVSKLLKELNIR